VFPTDSRGFRVISEEKASFEKFFTEKSQSDEYALGLKMKRFLPDRYFSPMLVTGYLAGPEYSVDVLIWDGENKIHGAPYSFGA
jgi:hypothetical protein